MAAAGGGAKGELINVLGDVKARMMDKLGILDFPIPNFILIGKQSAGKSRLIESLAGETFNYVSGTLGSRRPTVLEFRNVTTIQKGETNWYVRNQETSEWQKYSSNEVKRIVGKAHEDLGTTVSKVPIYVRMESPDCVDLQIVDLPGFRDYAKDDDAAVLKDKIEEMVTEFMRDPNNVMLCVEPAGDAANMATLGKCKQVDPEYKRTVLIRNKLDRFYSSLSSDNAEKWLDGYGDIPESIVKFTLTAPFWTPDTDECPNFLEIRAKKNKEDLDKFEELGVSKDAMKGIGFDNFAAYVEIRIQDMFIKALDPVMNNLRSMEAEHQVKEKDLAAEYENTDPKNIARTVRDCGRSFETALRLVMGGETSHKIETGLMTMADELMAFDKHIRVALPMEFGTKKGIEDGCEFNVPAAEMMGIDEYIEYLVDESDACYKNSVTGEEVPVNGGSQWNRMIKEVEIFMRFSEISVEIKKKDVIQARGVAMTNLTWRDVVRKLLGNEAHLPLEKRVRYIGERVKWFFLVNRDVVLECMCKEDKRGEEMRKHGAMVRDNDQIRHMLWESYEKAVCLQFDFFLELFNNMLTSTFSNPWVFLKGTTSNMAFTVASIADAKDRIPEELTKRSGMDKDLNQWLSDIPTDPQMIDDAVEAVQRLVLTTYSIIRSQVCDQVSITCDSFFKLPLLNRFSNFFSDLEISEQNMGKYEIRRKKVAEEKETCSTTLKEVGWCIKRLSDFKNTTAARSSLTSLR